MSSNVPNINLGATNPLDPDPNSDFNQDRVSRVSQSREQMMTGGWVEMDAMPFSPIQPAAACFEMYSMPSQVHHQGPPTAVIPSAPVYSSEPSLCKHISASEPSLLSAEHRSQAIFCARPNRASLSRHSSVTETSGGSSVALSQSQSSLDRLSPIYEVVSNLNLFGEVEDKEQYYAESESENGYLAESMTESDEQGGAHGRNDRKSARDGRTRCRETGAHAQRHEGRPRECEGARGNQHRKHKEKTKHTEQRHSHSGKKGKKTNRVAARRLYVELKASSDESSSSDSDSDLGQVVTHSHHHHEKPPLQNQSVNWGSKGVKKPPPYQENEDKFSDPEEPSTSTSRKKKKKKKKSKCCGKTSTRKKTAGFLAGLVVGIGATTAFIRSGGAGATAVAGFFGFAGAVNSGSTVEGNNNTVVGAGSNGLFNWNEMYIPPDPALLESLIERNQIKCLQAGMVLKDPSDNSWWGWGLRAKSPVCLMNLPGEMYQGACRLVGKFLKERERLDSSAAPPIAVPGLQQPQVGDESPTESAPASSTRASSTTGISFVPQQKDASQASTSGITSPRFETRGEGTSVANANDQVTTQSLLDRARSTEANKKDQTQGAEWLKSASKKGKANKQNKASKAGRGSKT